MSMRRYQVMLSPSVSGWMPCVFFCVFLGLFLLSDAHRNSDQSPPELIEVWIVTELWGHSHIVRGLGTATLFLT